MSKHISICSLALVVWLGTLPGCRQATAPAPPVGEPETTRPPGQLVVPATGAYAGAYIDFGDQEDAVTLEGIEDFDNLVGKHQAIVAFSSFWGEQSFPANAAHVVIAHGSMPMIFWSPWDRPYREDLVFANGPDKFSLEHILEGQWDAYIDRWADGVKAVGQPVFVSLCNEMNGSWFPWSGKYYAGGTAVAGTVPRLDAGPEYFKRAYRYIVDRVRARGGTNVLWVFHVNNFGDPYAEWNSPAAYYPGPDYVDWLGLSVYGTQFPEATHWDEFEDMLDKPYAALAAVDPTKPMMLAEWGVGEFPAKGNKAEWIKNAFATMQHSFPRLHAAVYWHERWQNTTNLLYSNLRVNSSPEALNAYRAGVAAPFWLDRPQYR